MTSTEFEKLREAILTVLDDGDPKCDCNRHRWHFFLTDEAESNAARLDFADAVISRTIKSIQRAKDENALICPECSGRNGHKSPFCPRIDFEEALKEM